MFSISTKRLSHGDFYQRNVLWNTSVDPPVATLIDFDRCEFVNDDTLLGCVWISSICSYLWETIELGIKSPNLPNNIKSVLDETSELARDFQKLHNILIRATRLPYVFTIERDPKRGNMNGSDAHPMISLNWYSVEQWCVERHMSIQEKEL